MATNEHTPEELSALGMVVHPDHMRQMAARAHQVAEIVACRLLDECAAQMISIGRSTVTNNYDSERLRRVAEAFAIAYDRLPKPSYSARPVQLDVVFTENDGDAKLATDLAGWADLTTGRTPG